MVPIWCLLNVDNKQSKVKAVLPAGNDIPVRLLVCKAARNGSALITGYQ
jgi:hypothetical protein